MKAIAAMAQNRVIGAGGRIPWHLPEDLQWFKQTTLGHVVVMGRKTYESIGRSLPGRVTLVLSRSRRDLPGARVIANWEEIEPLREGREVYLCGGAEVYAKGLRRCSDLYLTLVKRVVEGDAFFPSFEEQFEAVATILERPEFRIVHYRRRG